MDILVSKDNKGKIRVVEISYEWVDARKGYVIKRNTYQYGGKVTVQPEIWVFVGKAKRTVTEQVKLEYNSHLKKYQDKGYKLLPAHININQADKVGEFVAITMSDGVSDSNGFKKHMLAKQHDKVATSVFDKLKYWYASRKIDGVRASFYLKDEEVISASRGGGHYNFSTEHLRNHPKMRELFEKYPDLVLDGELYKHGKSLQQISGAARSESGKARSGWLEYYIYDVMDNNLSFEDRLEVLHDVAEALNTPVFNPEHEFEEEELKVQMVPHVKVIGWTGIEKLHNKYVEEGFEGVVIRDPSKPYSFGGRGNSMIKVKMYRESTFKVIGIEDGLREIDDICFICETPYGNTFKAKPMGSREVKLDYVNNFSEYLNCYGDVKFFYYSNDDNELSGVPLQPVFKCFRYDNLDSL